MEQKLLWVEEINKKKGFFKGQGKDIFSSCHKSVLNLNFESFTLIIFCFLLMQTSSFKVH